MIEWTGTGPRSHSYLAGRDKGKGKGKGKDKGKDGQPEPAAGGSPEPEDNTFVNRDKLSSGHRYRHARVCGLADLFCHLGQRFSAEALYLYYLSLPVIVHKRLHGKSAPERQHAALKRYDNTGYYGHGHGWQ